MLCISAYEYVVNDAKMITMFAVYLQASGFSSQSSEHGSSPDVDIVSLFSKVGCHRAGVYFLQQFEVHHVYPLFLQRGQY